VFNRIWCGSFAGVLLRHEADGNGDVDGGGVGTQIYNYLSAGEEAPRKI